MTLVAFWLVVTPLLRHKFQTARRVGGIRNELKALNAAYATGALNTVQYVGERRALGKTLLDYIDTEPKHSASMRYSAIAVAVLVPLSAFGLFVFAKAAQ